PRAPVATAILPRGHADDDARVLEDGQVAIRRAHGEAAPPVEDLVDREWMHGRRKDLEERPTARRQPLTSPPEPEGHDLVDVRCIATRINHGSPLRPRPAAGPSDARR